MKYVEICPDDLFSDVDAKNINRGYFTKQLRIGELYMHMIVTAVTRECDDAGTVTFKSIVQDEALDREISDVLNAALNCDAELLDYDDRQWFVWAHPYDA